VSKSTEDFQACRTCVGPNVLVVSNYLKYLSELYPGVRAILFGPLESCRQIWQFEYAESSSFLCSNESFVILDDYDGCLKILTERGHIGWVPEKDALGGKWYSFL